MQTFRARFYSLLHRQAYKGVHDLVPSDVLCVPKFVLLHVARSGKFIPTRKATNVKGILAGLDALKRQLLPCRVFQGTAACVSKCRLKSTWQPPGSAGVDAFVRLLSHELTQFEPKTFKSNQSWFDRKAKAWLRQHADLVAVVDCDKGLGDCLVLRSWLVEQVQLQLAQGYVQLSPVELQKKVAELKFGADAMVQFFFSSGVLSLAERDFLLSKFQVSAVGIFRILVKVHKQPVSSRPICNVRNSWYGPFSTFLVERLGPLMPQLDSVIVSSDQLLQQLKPLRCDAAMRFVTLDIVNLYPSVDRKHLMSIVGPFVRQSFNHSALGDFIVKALELVLEACVVSFQGLLFEAQDGIPTGLSVAGILANIYLWHFDRYMSQMCGCDLQILRRYIDDLLLLWAGDVQSLVEKAEGWHPSLKFQVSGEMEVPFLDFHLSILPNRRVHWKLFEKPQNLYLYVPAFSNHPASTFASLQLGGAIRCERRNRLSSDYAASIRSFKRRLKDRGFDLAGFDRLLARYRAKRMRRHAAPGLVRKAFLKLPYNKDISASWVSQKLRQFEPLLRQSVPALKLTTSWSVGRSLFQSRYKQVWKFLV